MTGRTILEAGIVTGAMGVIAGRYFLGHWSFVYALVGVVVALSCAQLEIVASLKRRAAKAEGLGDRYQLGYDQAKADTAAEIMGGGTGVGVLMGTLVTGGTGKGSFMCPGCRIGTMNSDNTGWECQPNYCGPASRLTVRGDPCELPGHHLHFTCLKCRCLFITPTNSTKEATA